MLDMLYCFSGTENH